MEKEQKKLHYCFFIILWLLGIIVFLFFLQSYIRNSWSREAHRKADIGCLAGNPRCGGGSITKEEFFREMNNLNVSKPELLKEVESTRIYINKLCINNELEKAVCNQSYDYRNRILGFLNEMKL